MNEILNSLHENFTYFLGGLWTTCWVTAASLLLGLPLGVFLAIASSAPARVVRWAAALVIEVGRGVPALVVLYFIYYGLPSEGLTLSSFWATAIGLAFTTGGYTSVIFVAGLRAVPNGQADACRALGMTRAKELRLVVLPQAARIVVRPILGWSIVLYQGTALAFAIALPELLSRAYNVGTLDYNFGPPLIVAGVMYTAVALLAISLLHLGLNSRRGLRIPLGVLSRPVVEEDEP
jgi:polar amino acid transport system permease protein